VYWQQDGTVTTNHLVHRLRSSTDGENVKAIDISPAAARLTSSMRDIGYDFVTAVADLVDNSIEAGARRVGITLEYDGPRSWVRLSDDGSGMTPAVLNEALRFGTRRSYGADELGRYGLGLKTASLSQCRCLFVATRVAQTRRWIHTRVIDLDYITETDSWSALEVPKRLRPSELVEDLQTAQGTVVLWTNLDRVFDGLSGTGSHGRRRMDRLAASTMQHLGMVFHRFIDGEAPGREQVKITVNDETVEAWDPFARSEPMTSPLPVKRFPIDHAGTSSMVAFRPYVLPHRDGFTSAQAFDRYSGPNRWNRQQGLYIYRAHRLIQAGGWSGMRAIDEHTKFARAAVEFDPVLDELFRVNVAKMKVSLPSQLRAPLQRSVDELIAAAEARYRRGELAGKDQVVPADSGALPDLAAVGLAIRAAAIEAGQTAALVQIEDTLRLRAPTVADAVGWSG
jgi:hypothetical protein